VALAGFLAALALQAKADMIAILGHSGQLTGAYMQARAKALHGTQGALAHQRQLLLLGGRLRTAGSATRVEAAREWQQRSA
jgi:hypothetical protein